MGSSEDRNGKQNWKERLGPRADNLCDLMQEPSLRIVEFPGDKVGGGKATLNPGLQRWRRESYKMLMESVQLKMTGGFVLGDIQQASCANESIIS